MNQHFGASSLQARAVAGRGLANAEPYAPVGGYVPPSFVRTMARAADVTIAVITGAAAAWIGAIDGDAIELSLVGGAVLAAFELLGLYAAPKLKSVRASTLGIIVGWAGVLGLVGVLSVVALRPSHVGLPLVLGYAAGACALLAGRLALARLIWRWERAGRLARRTAIYGTGSLADELIAALAHDQADLCLCGIYDDGAGKRSLGPLAGALARGGIEDLIGFARASRLDLVLVTIPISEEERLAAVVRRLSVLPLEIKLSAGATQIGFGRRLTSRAGEAALLDLVDLPIPHWGLLAKATFDKIVAGAALALLSPLMLAVAAAVKLESRGPVLFRQRRYGFNNELIEIFKFRSMYVEREDPAAVSLVTKCDARVTRVGRFIRRTSLDELPQLINVLRGELSLVGPRPYALQAKAGNRLYEAAVIDYFARHRVKPGITGWAQINGWRGETDTIEKIRKRVEHDLYYIENWSLAFDLLILARTPSALMNSENAY